MNIFQPIIYFFQNLNLAVKFAIMSLVFLIGIALIGFSFRTTLLTGQESLSEVRKLADFALIVDKIQFSVLEARRFEKDFRLSDELEFLEKFETNMQAARTALRGSESLSRTC